MTCSIEDLFRIYSCDPATGRFSWVEQTPGSHRDLSREPGCVCKSTGYRRLRVEGRLINAQRVAWALYYGEWPDKAVDHINGIKTDNRKTNLRLATMQQNLRNRSRANKNSKSGVLGVTQRKKDGKWLAWVKTGGRVKWIGSYATLEEAAFAREKAASEAYGSFAPNA